MLGDVNGKWSKWLPYVFMLVAALSRWPNLFPPNFSAFYGLAFCAGAFFPRHVKWWLPLGTLVVTDIALGFYYQSFSAMQLVTYAAFALIILFGTRFNHRSRFLNLLAGGIMGAVLFYFLTNTAAWLFNPFGNPEYTKDLAGWLIALTKGTGGYPTTLQFFLNTLHERRPVHRPVCRRPQTHRGRRTSQRKGARRRARARRPRAKKCRRRGRREA